MFAVIFDLEGQLDCTLHATETEASKEAARLSGKYATERANYSANVAVQAVAMPAPFIAAPAMLAALQEAQDIARLDADDGDLALSALSEIRATLAHAIAAATGTPTGNPNPKYVVDGHEYDDPDAPLAADGEFAPFFVFDTDLQHNIAGPFETRDEAQALADSLGGTPTGEGAGAIPAAQGEG